ncbi:MAG: hypothetical protein MZW92_35580 [Comamonadaceae bacterium]|nr:hypothetical protein [Comamonadaceae bacterium]
MLESNPGTVLVHLLMAQPPFSAAEMEASLHVWLETEFTYFKVEQLAAELAGLTRDEQDFILGWIRRIASTHITLAWQFGRRAPALLHTHGAAPAGGMGGAYLRRIRPYRPADRAPGDGRGRHVRRSTASTRCRRCAVR